LDENSQKAKMGYTNALASLPAKPGADGFEGPNPKSEI
jgi:hypothetical protein